MAEFSKCWSLFGIAFLLACEETGRAVAEGTHDGFAYLAEKTKPADKNKDVTESIPTSNTVTKSK